VGVAPGSATEHLILSTHARTAISIERESSEELCHPPINDGLEFAQASSS
jgi:hypothetical protein